MGWVVGVTSPPPGPRPSQFETHGEVGGAKRCTEVQSRAWWEPIPWFCGMVYHLGRLILRHGSRALRAGRPGRELGCVWAAGGLECGDGRVWARCGRVPGCGGAGCGRAREAK